MTHHLFPFGSRISGIFPSHNSVLTRLELLFPLLTLLWVFIAHTPWCISHKISSTSSHWNFVVTRSECDNHPRPMQEQVDCFPVLSQSEKTTSQTIRCAATLPSHRTFQFSMLLISNFMMRLNWNDFNAFVTFIITVSSKSVDFLLLRWARTLLNFPFLQKLLVHLFSLSSFLLTTICFN